MSTQAISNAGSRATSKHRSIWDRWRQPRIVAVDVSELVEVPTPSECYRRETLGRMNETSYGRTHVALAARWDGAIVGGAILELRDRNAFLHQLHVDAAWRGEGVGRRLMQGLFQRATLQFVHDVYVSATATDAGFYALHGFRPAEERHDLDDAPDRFTHDADILLRRRLTSGFVSVPYDGFTVKM